MRKHINEDLAKQRIIKGNNEESLNTLERVGSMRNSLKFDKGKSQQQILFDSLNFKKFQTYLPLPPKEDPFSI